MMNKKLIYLLMAIATLLPDQLSAQTYFTYEGINYKVIDESAKTCKILGVAEDYECSGDLVLPDKPMNGNTQYTPIELGSGAFYSCTGLTSITIPDLVTSIGESAFESCTSLTSIAFPESLTSIGQNAFYFCSSLTSITIPDGVTSIGRYAFEACTNLTTVVLPASLSSIERGTFQQCSSLTSVMLPKSLTVIGDSAFAYCTSLTSIAFPESLKIIDSAAFANCTSLTSIELPDSLTYMDGAFANCTSLTSIKLPDSLTYMDGAFQNCTSLTTIDFPTSLTSIGDLTFYGCTSLSSITIPSLVTWIGERAFSGCTSLTSIAFPESLTAIDEEAFKGCTSLTSIAFPESLTTIQGEAFKDCSNLTTIDFPASLTGIGYGAFYGTNIKEIYYYTYNPVNCLGSNQFDSNPTLYVAKGAKAQIINENLRPWCNFENIEEVQFVDKIEVAESEVNLYACCQNDRYPLEVKALPEEGVEVSLSWSSSDESVATVDEEGNVNIVAPGKTIITVVSNDRLGVKTDIAVNVVEHSIGDSNMSGDVTISDAVNTANIAVGNEPDNYCNKSADVNKDGIVTLADASATVSLILKNDISSSSMKVINLYDGDMELDALTVVDYNSNLNLGKSISINVGLNNTIDYVALQADIYLPAGLKLETITNGSRAANHALTYKQIGENIYRVILFDLGNSSFAESTESLFALNVTVEDYSMGDIVVNHILASDAKGNEHRLRYEGGHSNSTSGIGNVDAEKVDVKVNGDTIFIRGAAGEEVSICTTDGKVIAHFVAKSDIERCTLGRGVYVVITGKQVIKIIVK